MDCQDPDVDKWFLWGHWESWKDLAGVETRTEG